MSRLIRLVELEHLTGIKKSKIYQMIKEGSFPGAVRLGAKSVAWKEEEVQQWVDDLPRAQKA